MVKVLFVCLGNICRSPLAEGIFKSKISKLGLENSIVCDSAGTSSYHIGDQPDPRSSANALENGIQLNHAARQFSTKDFEDFDYILAMDQSNFRHVAQLENDDQPGNYKLFKMRHFDPKLPNSDVPDPYYGGPGGFQEVFDILDRSCDQFLKYIRDHHQAG